MNKHVDVLIVGAGASGIGVGIVLKQMGCENFCVIDKGDIGETFRRWPKEMRFITPSFPFLITIFVLKASFCITTLLIAFSSNPNFTFLLIVQVPEIFTIGLSL